MINNKVNGHKYIGQSCNIKKRLYEHKRQLNKNEHNNSHLQNAWNKYGEGSFEFKIIDDNIPPDEINDWEMYYITEIFNTYEGEGYNLHIGGNVMFGESHPSYGNKRTKRAKQLTSQKVRENNNPNAKLTVEDARNIMNDHKFSPISNSKLAKIYDVHVDVVSEIINGKHWTCKYLKDEFKFDGHDSLFEEEKTKRRMKNVLEYTLSDEAKKYKSEINKGFKNPHSKVTIEIARKILDERKYNNSLIKELSNKYGLSETIICDICNGNHWICEYLKDEYIFDAIGFKLTIEEAQEVWNRFNILDHKCTEILEDYDDKVSYNFLFKVCKGKHPLCNYINTVG